MQHISQDVKQGKRYIKENNIPSVTNLDSDIYKEQVTYNHNKLGKTVNCVTYSILENPGYKIPKYEAKQTVVEDIKELEKTLKDLNFRCFCIKWALETSIKKNSYDWSELYQKRPGSSKYYQEAIVNIDEVEYRIERRQYTTII